MEWLTRPIFRDGVSGTVGQCLSDQQHWVARLAQEELAGRYERVKKRSQIDFFSTGNCAFQRSLLDKYPFHEGFQRLEDVELSFRLAQHGTHITYVPEARVRHPQPERLSAHLARKFRYAQYASQLYRRYPSRILSDSSTPRVEDGSSCFWQLRRSC